MKNEDDLKAGKNVAAIVLAAGLSSRFSGNKLLCPLDGKPLVTYAIDSARASYCSRIYVVIDGKNSELKDVIPDGCMSIINEESEKGISISIRRGIETLEESIDAVVILLGDQPFVDSSMINSLVEIFEKTSAPVVSFRFDGKPRNPALFSKKVFKKLCGLKGDRGAQKIIAEMTEVKYLDINDPNVLFDIDSEDDLSVAESIIKK